MYSEFSSDSAVMEAIMGNQYIDFNHVKANTNVEAVLDALGIECKKRSGDEIRIHCIQPDHEDNRASCDVNIKNKAPTLSLTCKIIPR